MRIPTAVLTWLLAASLLSAQTLSFGLIGGASVTDVIDTHTTMYTIPAPVNGGYLNLGIRWWSQSKDWLAGAVFEFRFNSHVSAEIDGMYRELHATWAGVLPDGTLNSISPSPVLTWEFPLLAKYRLGVCRLKPFIEAGPSFRTTGNLNFEPSHYGFASAIGVETRWRGFDVAPVVRYTRWAHERYDTGQGETQLNQLEVLVAFKRETESHRSPLGSRISMGTVLGWGLTSDLSTTTTHFLAFIPSGSTFTAIDATQYYTGLKSMLAGATVEFHLPSRFSVEIDALHKSLRDQVRNAPQQRHQLSHPDLHRSHHLAIPRPGKVSADVAPLAAIPGSRPRVPHARPGSRDLRCNRRRRHRNPMARHSHRASRSIHPLGRGL